MPTAERRDMDQSSGVSAVPPNSRVGDSEYGSRDGRLCTWPRTLTLPAHVSRSPARKQPRIGSTGACCVGDAAAAAALDAATRRRPCQWPLTERWAHALPWIMHNAGEVTQCLANGPLHLAVAVARLPEQVLLHEWNGTASNPASKARGVAAASLKRAEQRRGARCRPATRTGSNCTVGHIAPW